MSVPDNVRLSLRRRLWEAADRLNWMNLSGQAKSKQYDAWTADPAVGGLLSRYVSQTSVRTYIKDSLLKDYVHDRLGSEETPFRVLGLNGHTIVNRKFISPHGRALSDGRVICWGRADEWKVVLMAVHERAHQTPGGKPHAAVLMQSNGRMADEAVRQVVEDAATKLGIERLLWLES